MPKQSWMVRKVRLLSGPSLLAVLGFGGLALAQSGLIVDPWKRPVTLVVGTKPAPPAVLHRSAQDAPVLAPFPEEPNRKPAVVPIGPPLNLTNESPVVPLGPFTHDEIFDPWASTRSDATTSARSVATTGGRRDWAFEINEIVDPWSRGPLAAVTDPLIVYPWAR
jgi:hypothetical protein